MTKEKEDGVGVKANCEKEQGSKSERHKERTRTIPRTELSSGDRFRRVPFYGAEGCMVLENNARFWVDLEGLCWELGLDPESHCASISKVPDFKLRIFVYDDLLSGEIDTLYLAADQIGAWIFMIDPALVAADARPVLSIYRRGLQHAVNDFIEQQRYRTVA